MKGDRRESAGVVSTHMGISLRWEPGHLASLPSASGGVSLALTAFPSLIKHAFHMTARKERKKNYPGRTERLEPEDSAELSIFLRALGDSMKCGLHD